MKSPLKSKTIWLNLLLAAAGVCTYLAGAEPMQEYTTILPVFVAVSGALNIILRFLTTEPIK